MPSEYVKVGSSRGPIAELNLSLLLNVLLLALVVLLVVKRRRAPIAHAPLRVDDLEVRCKLNSESQIIEVSGQTLPIFGYEPSELKDRLLIEFSAPADAALTFANLSERLAGTTRSPFDSKISRADGSPVDVRWTPVTIEPGKSITLHVLDITESKNAERMLAQREEELRSILEGLPAAVLIIDHEGQIHRANPAAEAIFGLSRSKLQQQRLGDLCYEKAPGSALAILSLLSSQNNGKRLTAQNSTGKEIPVEVFMQPFGAPDDMRFVVALLDVSRRAELEKSKQEFVAVISHEIRTPLTSLQAFLGMLVEGVYGPLGEKVESRLEASNRSVSRIISLVNDLLDLDKIEAGQFEFDMRESDTQRICARAVESVQHFAQQSGIKLIATSKHCTVFGDEERLVQVLVNLLSNAIKFSSAGDEVRLRVEENADTVEISVTDSGCGISPQQMSRLFDKYAGQNQNTNLPGTGLGLAICKSIVQQHKGNIGVESSENRGTNIWVALPKRGAATAAIEHSTQR